MLCEETCKLLVFQPQSIICAQEKYNFSCCMLAKTLQKIICWSGIDCCRYPRSLLKDGLVKLCQEYECIILQYMDCQGLYITSNTSSIVQQPHWQRGFIFSFILRYRALLFCRDKLKFRRKVTEWSKESVQYAKRASYDLVSQKLI